MNAIESWDAAVHEFDAIIREAVRCHVYPHAKNGQKLKIRWTTARYKCLNIQVDRWEGEGWVYENSITFNTDATRRLANFPFQYGENPGTVASGWGWNVVCRFTPWQWLRGYLGPAKRAALINLILSTKVPGMDKWSNVYSVTTEMCPNDWTGYIPTHVRAAESIHASVSIFRPGRAVQTECNYPDPANSVCDGQQE